MLSFEPSGVVIAGDGLGLGRPVAASIEDLLGGEVTREPLRRADSKSEVLFERVVIDGRPYVLKHLHCDGDWIARGTGDLTCRPLVLWRGGILDMLPECLDHAVVAVAGGLGRHGWGAAVLMRDVSEWLIPEGDTPLPWAQHRGFLNHMAALHAAFWGFEDTVGLTPCSHRYLLFGPCLWETEAALGSDAAVPRLAYEGWSRFRDIAPRAASVVLPLLTAPWPLVQALETTPATFIHGDWKAGNLGTGPNGRTLLLDWALSGRGSPCAELAWYLSINAARLPESYEDAIAAYRRCLEGHGVDTGGWWERQLGLALLGALVQFGWDKALHGTAEDLHWWEERAFEGVRWLG
ncbi:MAG: phosphotransferase family protein [Pseudonocardiaceae bacterium]